MRKDKEDTSFTETQTSADQIPLMILTNERTPYKAKMLGMLYQAAGVAQLAYMDGLDPDTKEVTPLLVGLEPIENEQFNVYPLAKLFNSPDGIPKYLVPDGKGSYLTEQEVVEKLIVEDDDESDSGTDPKDAA